MLQIFTHSVGPKGVTRKLGIKPDSKQARLSPEGLIFGEVFSCTRKLSAWTNLVCTAISVNAPHILPLYRMSCRTA